MKIQVLQENLNTALKAMTKAVPSKPQLPILATILLSVGDGEVILSATDLYLGMKVRVPASIEEEGIVAIPARTFMDSINALSPGKLDLVSTDQSLKITNSATSISLQVQPGEEFPAFPDLDGQTYTFQVADLEQIDQLLSYSVSLDPTRLILTTILFQPLDGKVELVATDGFRLGILSFAPETFGFTQPVNIPAKALTEVVKIAAQQKVDTVSFTLSEEQKQLFFTLGDITMYVRLVEGQFPPYQKIMPADFVTEVKLDGGTLTERIKQAQIMAREVSNIVTLEVKPEELVVSATASTQGSFSASMPSQAIKIAEPITIAFNSRYVLDFLTKVKPDEVLLQLNDPLKPAVFKNTSRPQYQYIVMPFRVNQA